MAEFRVTPLTACFVRLATGLLVAASSLAVSASPAHARAEPRQNYRDGRGIIYQRASHNGRGPASFSSDPAFAEIVVDANTGREIFGVNENGLRHPASITKVMTLYLLFEQLDRGALTLQSPIPISEHAAAQEPSKLGISAGDSLSVEDAIKALVTRSANDVAVAIAEAIGGDEANFAQMMTRKAHALGMSRTIYRNASGLPNDEQVTTARDLTVLARATEERFPKYFHYFSTHEFSYDGEIIGNHNHLLGHIDGVDGIKTGYTRASGYNLLTSVHRDGRSLVAVVMGGRTWASRDHLMEQLIADHIEEASTHGHIATMIADNEPPAPLAARISSAVMRSPPVVAAEMPMPPARPTGRDGAPASNEDLLTPKRQRVVKTRSATALILSPRRQQEAPAEETRGAEPRTARPDDAVLATDEGR